MQSLIKSDGFCHIFKLLKPMQYTQRSNQNEIGAFLKPYAYVKVLGKALTKYEQPKMKRDARQK